MKKQIKTNQERDYNEARIIGKTDYGKDIIGYFLNGILIRQRECKSFR